MPISDECRNMASQLGEAVSQLKSLDAGSGLDDQRRDLLIDRAEALADRLAVHLDSADAGDAARLDCDRAPGLLADIQAFTGDPTTDA